MNSNFISCIKNNKFALDSHSKYRKAYVCLIVLYWTDISCLGVIFAKYTSPKTITFSLNTGIFLFANTNHKHDISTELHMLSILLYCILFYVIVWLFTFTVFHIKKQHITFHRTVQRHKRKKGNHANVSAVVKFNEIHSKHKIHKQ